jgi:UDP-N-acetyl-2-amino-2-deoxyglucuronate dehydrogenase
MSKASAGAGVVGVGVVGCGSIGPLHAEALARVDGARLVAVADTRAERAGALATRYGVSACASLEDLLAVPGVDLVCVCTPSGTHGELAVEAARAGRHVVLEKPIDVSLEAADAAIAACAAAGVTLSVVSQHRFDPGVLTLKEALERGELGKVSLAEARAWWYRTQAYYDSDSWRGTAALDGGALMNQGVHLVDLLMHLLGPVRSVFARAATVAHQIECEDLALVSAELASGALASLAVTTASYPGAPETLGVTGDKASVLLEAGSVVSWRVAEDSAYDLGPQPQHAASAAAGSANLAVTAHRAQLQDVVDAVRNGRSPAVTGDDGRRALQFVRAAYESAASGREVLLSPGRQGDSCPLAGRLVDG